jgi:hypothetical protein
MALILLEDRDFKGFWMEIWNAGVSVITKSTFSSLKCNYNKYFVENFEYHVPVIKSYVKFME